MSGSKRYEPPPTLTVKIAGSDRAWVAEALRCESRKIREQFEGRRATSTFGKAAHARATRLWSLADQVEP